MNGLGAVTFTRTRPPPSTLIGSRSEIPPARARKRANAERASWRAKLKLTSAPLSVWP